MIKCIIVDDEYKSIELLKGYIADVPYLELKETFRNPVTALSFIQDSQIDLIFLDINMPRLDGISFLKSMKHPPMIIFTTAYSEHAVDGFELEAIDYLLKPITLERFMKAVAKAKAKSTPSEYILVKSGPQTYQIKRDDIHLIEKDGNYATFHTTGRKIVTRMNFSDVIDLVGQEEFVRVHKSFVVAVRSISLIESNELIVQNVKVPVGAVYKDGLLKKLGAK